MSYSEEQVREIFFEEMRELLENIERCITSFEVNPSNIETVLQLFRDVHTLKGSSGVFGLREISDLTHRMEDLLDAVRKGALVPNESVFGLLFSTLDRTRKMMVEARAGRGLGAFDNGDLVGDYGILLGKGAGKATEFFFEISMRDAGSLFARGLDPRVLLLNCKDLATRDFRVRTNLSALPEFQLYDPERCYSSFEISFWSDRDENEIRDVFEFVEGTCSFSLSASRGKTGERADSEGFTRIELDQRDFLKVPVERLDHLITLTGRLSQIRNSLSGLQAQLDNLDAVSEMSKQFAEQMAEISRLTEMFQESVMSMRMVSIGMTFVKYTRLVRDIAKKLCKKVNLVVEGDDIEIDKLLSDAISDPVMHLIRNAIDHGIESPARRLEIGKPETGTILLRAFYEGEKFVILVKDDGRGIDLNRIREKAIAMGIATSGEIGAMNEREIVNLIYRSGFSTATKITDVSGRGVGMDVVRSNIQRSGGTIIIDTESGKGTEFRLVLPVSSSAVESLRSK